MQCATIFIVLGHMMILFDLSPVFCLLDHPLEPLVDLLDLLLQARGRGGVGHAGKVLLHLGQLLHLESLTHMRGE